MEPVKWILFLLVLSSCKENPQEYNSIISGKILSSDGFYLSSGNLVVGTNQYTMLNPDSYGNFYFDNVNPPYDLYVSSDYTNHYGIFLYIGLNTTKPVIIYPLRLFGRKMPCSLPVKFPPVQKGKIGILQFTSTEVFQEGYWKLSEGDSVGNLTIKISGDKPSVHGQLIFLQCGLSDDSVIISYDNFGMKDVNIQEGNNNNNVVFTPEEIGYNPKESTVNVNVIPYNNNITVVAIHFPGLNPNSDVYIGNTTGTDSKIIVPAELKIPFKIKITNKPHNEYSDGPVKSIFLNPGESGTLDNSRLIPLIYPFNEQENINDTIILRYGDDNPGIYCLTLYDREDYNEYLIFLEKNNLKIGDLKNRGLTFTPGHTYEWFVIEYSEFNNLDQFVSSPYLFQENFNVLGRSNGRRFTMAH